MEATGFTYPAIRVVYREHPQADKLPDKPSVLPLLVFIHGLGGSAAQFAPLLTSLINVGPCLCIDLPGCGLSHFSPEDWAAYTQQALTELLKVIVESHRNIKNDQKIVFVAHSMGCSLAASVASSPSMKGNTTGLIALCPRITPMAPAQADKLKRILSIPTPIFDLMRAWDRRGGTKSTSVSRFVGPDADAETKKLQLRFNEQSKTAVWRRMTYGLLPGLATQSTIDESGLAGIGTWAGIGCPILLIGGECDNLNPPSEVHQLASDLRQAWTESPAFLNTTDTSGTNSDDKPPRSVKAIILPELASHALLFAPQQCRVVSGLIQAFFAEWIDTRLSLGWQLQYLSKEGKWDVKNLAKWQKIRPVSEPIGGIFRAMKTMREVDDSHNPTAFCQQWRARIRAVVDISHESPVYDPRKLEEGGIEYQKFPTVSKLPPKAEEVQGFNDLIDQLRASTESAAANKDALIGVHCHYGFNRTGFFVVCYLVERAGWRLPDAIEEFESKRPPGIKHQHFIDELSVRYCTGLARSSTL